MGLSKLYWWQQGMGINMNGWNFKNQQKKISHISESNINL